MTHLSSDNAESVNYNDIPKAVDIAGVDGARWSTLLALREDVKKALELARAAKAIGASLEAAVVLGCEDAALAEQLAGCKDLLKTLFIVSQIDVVQGAGEGFAGEALKGITVAVTPAPGDKCERCWKVLPEVGQDAAHSTLCPRCAEVVSKL